MRRVNSGVRRKIDEIKEEITSAYNMKVQSGITPTEIGLPQEYAGIIALYFSEFAAYFRSDITHMEGISDLINERMLLGRVRVTSVHASKVIVS